MHARDNRTGLDILPWMLAVLGVAMVTPTMMAQDPPVGVWLGPIQPAPIPTAPGREVCGELLFTADRGYNAGFTWQFEGVQPPYYGAFAECYSGSWEVCAAVFDLTTQAGLPPATLDAYVWEDADGEPGAVLSLVTGFDPGPIARWPNTSRHEVLFPEPCRVDGDWWVGWWPNWPGGLAGWFIPIDMLYNFGCPFTNVAPDLWFPPGWQHIDVVYGPGHLSFGIGAEVLPPDPTPVLSKSWGAVKALYTERRDR